MCKNQLVGSFETCKVTVLLILDSFQDAMLVLNLSGGRSLEPLKYHAYAAQPYLPWKMEGQSCRNM
jgi:hypothetical protein